MLRSSLGFHTMTLSLSLEYKEVQPLIKHFRKYSQNTELIQIYRVGERNKLFEYNPTQKYEYILPRHIKIRYYKEDHGIKWDIRISNWSDNFKSYMVEATINPKILGGIQDYITAATYDDMGDAITNFNLEAEKISPILKTFDCYSLKRIDYCINFDLNELISGINPELIMNLIKRGDIPHFYKEWTEYDHVSHRKKSKSSSFYLINPSANINCYSKYMQLMERSRKNEDRGFPPIPQSTLNAAKSIIRFEVQCKYHKMYTLSSRAEEAGNRNCNKYESLLPYEVCNETINYYFNKTVGKGDWHTLQDAIRIIKSCNFNSQKEKRLMDALVLVNCCRSLAKAKENLHSSELEAFKRTLKELSGLNINPVTIPKEWGYRYIPNLLYTYYDKAQKEKAEIQRMEEFLNGGYVNYNKEFGCLFG